MVRLVACCCPLCWVFHGVVASARASCGFAAVTAPTRMQSVPSLYELPMTTTTTARSRDNASSNVLFRARKRPKVGTAATGESCRKTAGLLPLSRSNNHNGNNDDNKHDDAKKKKGSMFKLYAGGTDTVAIIMLAITASWIALGIVSWSEIAIFVTGTVLCNSPMHRSDGPSRL
jgi:hypothetical protein